jgi:hypothetical protein
VEEIHIAETLKVWAEEEDLSDHALITVELLANQHNAKQGKAEVRALNVACRTRYLQAVNWEEWKFECDGKLEEWKNKYIPEQKGLNHVDIMWKAWIEAIQQVAENFLGRKKNMKRKDLDGSEGKINLPLVQEK